MQENYAKVILSLSILVQKLLNFFASYNGKKPVPGDHEAYVKKLVFLQLTKSEKSISEHETILFGDVWSNR